MTEPHNCYMFLTYSMEKRRSSFFAIVRSWLSDNGFHGSCFQHVGLPMCWSFVTQYVYTLLGRCHVLIPSEFLTLSQPLANP